jgi:hypothetical protein
MLGWLLLPMLCLLPMSLPVASEPPQVAVPISAELWLNPGTGWSDQIEVPTSGWLTVAADSPPGRSLETMTLWVSKHTPGACNSVTLDEIPLTTEPVALRYRVEPGTYSVGVLMSNRTHYIHTDDPLFERLVRVTVVQEPD